MSVKKSKKKKSKLILGADPGKGGAIVLIKKDTGKIFKMFSVPKIKGHKKSTEPDWHEFDDIIKKYRKRIEHAFLEKPTSGGAFAGRTQSLKLGDAIGTFRTLLIANEIRFTVLAPTKWQNVMFQGIPVIAHPKKETKEEKEKRKKLKRKKPAPKVKDNKAMSIEAAKRLFPKVNFIPEGCRTPFDGWTDAALIALYGLWQIGVHGLLKINGKVKKK